MQKTQVWSLGWEDPQRRARLPTPVFLPGKSHGQRSLEGYGPWGCRLQLSNLACTLLLQKQMNSICEKHILQLRAGLKSQFYHLAPFMQPWTSHDFFGLRFLYLQNRCLRKDILLLTFKCFFRFLCWEGHFQDFHSQMTQLTWMV